MRTTWTFHSAGQLLFGPNATHHLGEVAVGLNIRRLLLVTDSVLMGAGIVDPVLGPLSEAGGAVEGGSREEPMRGGCAGPLSARRVHRNECRPRLPPRRGARTGRRQQ